MDSMPVLDHNFNYDEINLDFLESPPRAQPIVTTLSTPTDTNSKSSYWHEHPINRRIIPIAHGELEADKTEIKDFNLDFFQSPKKKKPQSNFISQCLTQETCTAGVTIKTAHPSNIQSSKKLAQRIALVDTLVRQLKAAEKEISALQKQMEDFNKSAREVQLMYNEEKSARVEAETRNRELETQCADLDKKLAYKSWQLDQWKPQLKERSVPFTYSELATRYLKLAHKLNEERSLHHSDLTDIKNIAKYCKDENLKVPTIVPRSQSKRKPNVEIQCDLEIEKPKIQQRHQSTQSDGTETRTQACQHIGTTTTRGTTTDCFFKYHDVGTNCEPINVEPVFNDILEEMRTFGDQYAPLSPIADILEKDEVMPMESISPLPPLPEVSSFSANEVLPKIIYNTIGTNTGPQSPTEYKSAGTCTYICNVQRPLDFVVQPPITIKRSTSRPPSAGLAFETVKDELNSRSSNTSPINFNANVNAINHVPPILPTPSASSSSSSASILPNAFDELWQIFGHIMFGVLYRRSSSLNGAGNSGGISFAPNDITNQQDFHNWLHALYNNVQSSQTNLPQSVNPSAPIIPRRHTSRFSAPDIELAASCNRSTSTTTNENTPLSFSDAAPNVQTVPNVMKPTALRSNLRDSSGVEVPNSHPQTPIVWKSVATSPIRCLDAKPINNSFSGTVELSNGAENSNASAFKRTNVIHEEERSNSKESTSAKTNDPNVLKKTSVGLKKFKRSRLIKYRATKNMGETAVDFLAKLQQPQEEHELNKAAKTQGNSHSSLKSGHAAKQQKCDNELQQLNYRLFGSSPEADKDIKTTAETFSRNASTTHYSSSDTFTSSSSSSHHGSDENDHQSLQNINDFIGKVENKQREQLEKCKTRDEHQILVAVDVGNQFKSKSLINEYIPGQVSLQPETQLKGTSQVADENKVKLNFRTATTIVSRIGARSAARSINETPKKRGRKRKEDTTDPASPPEMSPCKRSARLLARQVNQQVEPNTQLKQLRLLPLDFSSSSAIKPNNKSDEPSNNSARDSKRISKNDLRSHDFARINEDVGPSLSRDQKPDCSPYSLRKVHPTSTVASKPSDATSKLTMKSCSSKYMEETANKSDAMQVASSSFISPMTASTAISLKNFNFKSASTSSIYTTPYALHNSATLPTTVTNPKSCATTSNNLLSSCSTISAKDFAPIKTAKLHSSQKSEALPSTSSNSAPTSIEPAQTNAEARGQAYNVCFYANTSEATKVQPFNSSIETYTNPSSSLLSPLSNGAQIPHLSFYPTKETPDSTETTIEPERNFATTCYTNLANSVGIEVKKRVVLNTNANCSRSTTDTPTRSKSGATLTSSTSTCSAPTSTLEIPFKRTNSTPHPYNSISIETSNTPVDFTSPPASPILSEMEQVQATPTKAKEIPLELSVANFPTWRRWRSHQRSLMHNLISAYDPNLYQAFNGNETTETEVKKAQQLAVHIDEYIKQTADQQINATTLRNVELAVSHLMQKLQQITSEPKLIAQAVLTSVRKQPRPIPPPYEQYSNGTLAAPVTPSAAKIHDPLTNQTFSTHAHRCCAYLLKQSSGDISTTLLQLIESTLFDTKGADTLSLHDALNLTDLHLLVLRQGARSIEPNPARLFIAKCLYYHKLKAAPMIYAVLCTFPTVLPHREERLYDRSDALITVLQHCLMGSQYDMNNSELLQREVLSKLRYEYHFECFRPDFNEVLTNLVEKLRAGKLENLQFAFGILCKRQAPERVVRDVLQQHFMPLANEYYRLVGESDAYEARLATLLDCFSTVIKPFPRNSAACMEIPNYLNFFKRFLTMSSRPLVAEAAAHAILRLQRFHFLNCYLALEHWRPEFELQPNTRAALRTFIYRKPFSFWKSLMQQSS